MENENDFLEHYGIKGMHWGVWNEETQARRTGGFKRNARKAKEKAKSYADSKAKKDAYRRESMKALANVHTMSDSELDRRINRLNKQKQLRQLTESEVVPGYNAVNGVLKTSGKIVLTTVATGAGLAAVRSAITGEKFSDIVKEEILWQIKKKRSSKK